MGNTIIAALMTLLGPLIAIAVPVYAIFVVALLIYDERDPSTTLLWAFVLLTFPGIGLVLYLLFGRNWKRISRSDRRLMHAQEIGRSQLEPLYDRWADAAAEHMAKQPVLASRIAHSITRQNGTRVLPATNFQLMPAGSIKFPALFADIERATSSVHLEYFIWECDELTGQLCELLAKKVAEGVEVRVLYDWVGSYPFKKDQLKRLKVAGGQVHADIAHISKINYRNHRKMAIIDGRIGYTGGMNMGKEYIDGLPRYESWRDTHVRFEGPLVAELQRMFSEQWYRVTEQSLFASRYFPELQVAEGERVVFSQLTTSGPESPLEEIRNAFMLAILSAEKCVRIQSPYFVPDDPIMQALIAQSLSGVEVDFMMTGLPDKKIAWNAAFSYIDDFVDAGGVMRQYMAGFFHAKAMTIDGAIATIGTTNFDIRSFMLHDELSIFFYDREVAEAQDAVFAADIEKCRIVDESIYGDFGRLIRFRNAFMRLWSRLL
ncbi:MAG TPA: cardiolipin synthase [Coriobacteriia bacterium]|nr:cardiolipin synthase [Coriobacteriia bacterium]